jgi:serine/threonine protein kinase
MRKICLRCGSKFGSRAEYCPHDGSLLATDEEIADPLLGAVLLEQFRVEKQIGVGGMGTVYRAHQTTIGRDVAIKVLRPELARDEQAVARFEREARLATSLDHPNLVRVFLSGRLPDNRLYIVMELLEGRSLADELDEHGVPSLERAVIMIMKLCAGLGAVHDAGIVHRDVKPENIYLVRRGRDNDFVKLVDFGVARVLEADGTGPTTTQSGRVFGTATYISPEAATGDETDHRSDIYSLGVLSYQLLTGELPFEGATAGAVLMQHVHNEPPLLQTKGRGAEVPDDVARVVMRSLSKEPEARQQTLAEFLDSLAEAAGNAGLLADARGLLLGTVWGDELAAPGTYLAELLGSSQPSSLPPALAAMRPLATGRDAEEEALLSSAPKPFGTSSHDLVSAPASTPEKSKRGWLWATLALAAVVLIGFVAGAWFRQQAPTPIAVEPPPSIEAEPEPIADVGTNVPVVEMKPVEEVEPVDDVEPVGDVEPVDEVAPVEEVVEESEPPEAKPKPIKKKRKKPKKPAPVLVPAPVPEPASASEPALEPDEGIDWTVPDFLEEPSQVEPPTRPTEPAAPTGSLDAQPRNPVVIDEVPQ